MIFRRKSRRDGKSDDVFDDAGDRSIDESVVAADDFDELDTPRPRGPWDRAETTVDEDDPGYIDLGGLLIKGNVDLELRLQIEEASSVVVAALLAGEESGLELRAFAAPRFDAIWPDVRREIGAEAAKQGGTATELDGEFGTELQVKVPVQMADGRTGQQIVHAGCCVARSSARVRKIRTQMVSSNRHFAT